MGPCATPEQLAQFLVDGLDGQRGESVAAHIEGCSACRQVLEQLTTGRDPKGGPRQRPAREERDARMIERLKLENGRVIAAPSRGPGDDRR